MRFMKHCFAWGVGVLLLTACAPATSVKDIQAHPRDYADKTVTIRGEVRNVFSLVFFKYFTVDDGTGSIAVVTERPLPSKGEKLTVTGTVKEAFSLGDQTMTLIVEDKPSASK